MMSVDDDCGVDLQQEKVHYLLCPAGVTTDSLKKFIRTKYDLVARYQVSDVRASFDPKESRYCRTDRTFLPVALETELFCLVFVPAAMA